MKQWTSKGLKLRRYSKNMKPLLTVTGAQRPYVYDLPHLLALPCGFEFRFRYRHRWVSKSVLDSITKDGQAFAGRSIVIIFHSQDTKTVIPVRMATILGIESIGPMIFVRFRAGAFFKANIDIESYSYDVPKNGDIATKGLVSRAKRLMGIVDGRETVDFSGALPAGSYLREAAVEVEEADLEHDEPVAAWARLVAVLHREPSLSGIPFFHLLGFRSENGTDVLPESVRNRFSPTKEAIGGFRLCESDRYRMRVAEWCETPKSGHQRPVLIDCDFNRSHFALEGSSNLVVGRYDVIEFTFSCLSPGYSEMALRAQPLQDHAEERILNTASKESGEKSAEMALPSLPMGHSNHAPPWDTWPAIFVARVPVVVRARAVKVIAPIVALVVGVALYLVLAPVIGARFGERWKGLGELAGLAVLYFGYGAVVERLEKLFKLSAGLNKLGGGVAKWAGGK